VDSELVDLFTRGLALSQIKASESVLVYADTQLPWPEYCPAVVQAVAELGAEAYVLTGPGRAVTAVDTLVLNAWKNADLVIQLARPGVPIHSPQMPAVLQSGTRVLGLRQRPATLRAMCPSTHIVERGYAAGRLVAGAAELRVTSESGTDLRLRVGGRKGHVQVGVADAPGMWDDFGSGQVAVAPLEDATEGTYVISPGDALMTLRRHASSPLRLVFREGAATEVEGAGDDADLVREFLARPNDPNAYRVAHAGWGLHPGADWTNPWAQDAESLAGVATISLGANVFDTPHPHRGYGGRNACAVHLDICCRATTIAVDGQVVVEHGMLVN
jgi:2,5-dihydroxypyridine 5,6-dioxygenase